MGEMAPQGLRRWRKKAVDPSMRLAATAVSSSSSWPCGGLEGEKGWGWGHCTSPFASTHLVFALLWSFFFFETGSH